ncbi:MAG: sodium-dependent transporter, partial [Methanobrevibacter sp.]
YKIGKTWKFIIRYFIPIVIGIMWITGNIQNFTSGDSNQIIIQGLLLLVMIVIPILFTKAKPKVDDY